MKVASIGDLHINVWKKDDIKYQHIEKTFTEFKKFCIKHEVRLAVIMGDLFDTKTMTSTEGLLHVINVIDNLAETVMVYIIVGNHDIASATDTSMSLPNIFKNKKNIVVVDEYKSILNSKDKLHFLPYMKDDKIIKAVKEINTNTPHNYLFGHFGVRNFVMNMYDKYEQINKYTDTTSQCSPGMFKEFNHVYLGHYHGYQTKENITYVGSPIQLRHGEQHGRHGFVLIDTVKNTHEFTENKFTPQHITIELKKDNMEKIKELKNNGNHYIKLIIPKKISKQKIIKLRDTLSKKNFDVQILPKESDDNVAITVVDGWDDFTKQDAETLLTNFLDENINIIEDNKWNRQDMLDLVLGT